MEMAHKNKGGTGRLCRARERTVSRSYLTLQCRPETSKMDVDTVYQQQPLVTCGSWTLHSTGCLQGVESKLPGPQSEEKNTNLFIHYLFLIFFKSNYTTHISTRVRSGHLHRWSKGTHVTKDPLREKNNGRTLDVSLYTLENTSQRNIQTWFLTQ